MNVFFNKAFLHYFGKTIPSNTVFATLGDKICNCDICSTTVASYAGEEEEQTYTYSIKEVNCNDYPCEE